MNGFTIMLLGGGGLAAYLLYDMFRYRLRVRGRREGRAVGPKTKVKLQPRTYVLVLFVILLALLFARGIPRQVAGESDLYETHRSLWVAIYVLVVGLWWIFYQAGKAAVSERLLINDQCSELVNAFKSVYRIRPTVFSALEEANRKIGPPVGTAAAHAVTTFYVTAIPQRAFDELRDRIKNPYMEQFVYILERGEDAKHEDIMTALSGLQDRLRRARELRDHSEVNMTVINGQTRIIQLIAVTLVTVVAIVPQLRVAYEGPIGQILFMIIASIGVATSYFMDKRATALKERVL